MAEHELSRSDVIVALGGGVVGGTWRGFVAATYMRGCKFVQIPTQSLLAMVGFVGRRQDGHRPGALPAKPRRRLWQPSVVIADVGCWQPSRPNSSPTAAGGSSKHAVIADPSSSPSWRRPLTLELLNRDVARVALIIARNIDIKRAVVVADERETNQRKLLNFGHSAGHAVEACEHFELGHGNCVSIGMGIITRAAALHGICDAELPGRELCARPQDPLRPRCRYRLCRGAPRQKARGRHHRHVIPHGIGRCSIDRTPLSTFHDLIAEGLGQKGNVSAC